MGSRTTVTEMGFLGISRKYFTSFLRTGGVTQKMQAVTFDVIADLPALMSHLLCANLISPRQLCLQQAVYFPLFYKWGLPWWLSGEESACQHRRPMFDPWIGEILWRRVWQPTLYSCLGESHGQRNLVFYSSWCCKRVGYNLATKQQ